MEDPVATDAEPVGPPDPRALRLRILERVADAEPSHVTISAAEGTWRPFREGVLIKVLHESGGVLSCLLRLAPGASLPAHRHPCDEECVVLEGRLEVGRRIAIEPGGYHLAHAGALHATIRAPEGAMIYLRGAVPDPRHALG